MKIEKIQMVAEASKGIPSSIIEYNCELPKHPHIKKNSFFGVKAVFNPDMGEDRIQSIYKM